MGGYSNRGIGSAFHEKNVENKPPQCYFCIKLTPGAGENREGGFSNWYTGLHSSGGLAHEG